MFRPAKAWHVLLFKFGQQRAGLNFDEAWVTRNEYGNLKCHGTSCSAIAGGDEASNSHDAGHPFENDVQNEHRPSYGVVKSHLPSDPCYTGDNGHGPRAAVG